MPNKIIKTKSFLLPLLFFMLLTAFVPIQKKKIFKNKKEAISIELPREWKVKTLDNDTYSQMIVFLENPKKKGDPYTTGVSITKITSMSRTYPQIKSDEDIVKLWYTATKQASQKHYLNEEVNFENLSLGNYKGIIVELILQPTQEMSLRHMYQAILAYKDDLYTIVLECPAENWKTYEPTFEAALASVVLK